MRDIEAEMIRSHALCLKISSKKPTDPDYKSLLEKLFQHEVDDSTAIVSPFEGQRKSKLNLQERM